MSSKVIQNFVSVCTNVHLFIMHESHHFRRLAPVAAAHPVLCAHPKLVVCRRDEAGDQLGAKYGWDVCGWGPVTVRTDAILQEIGSDLLALCINKEKQKWL